jgi:SAM-dependent methyltransferase
MFIQESEWIINVLDSYVTEAQSVIDVGSGGSAYLQKLQNRQVHDYLRSRGMCISTLDKEPGSNSTYICDIAEDLQSDNELPQFDLVLCTNLLEHVSDIKKARDNIQNLIKCGGYSLITVPHRFPYHPRPIDNRYRPTNKKLEELFPDLHSLYSETFKVNRDKLLHWLVCPINKPEVSGVLFKKYE